MSSKRVAVVSDHMKLYGGKELERGEVFQLQNLINDLKLIGWNYIREIEDGEETYTCKCAREFLGEVTGSYVRAHLTRWRGECSPPIVVDGVQIKGSNRKPAPRGGGNPDSNDAQGWDLGAGGPKIDGPVVDPFAGERNAAGKEVPKRIKMGG